MKTVISLAEWRATTPNVTWFDNTRRIQGTRERVREIRRMLRQGSTLAAALDCTSVVP